MTPTQLLASPRERKQGRPPMNPSTSRFWETPLHTLLAANLDHIPGMVIDGRIAPAKLAKEIGCCRFTAYRWLGESRVSPKGAGKIIDVSSGRLTKEQFAPFLIL